MGENTHNEAGEIRSLLDAVYSRYGFDFRDYAYPSINRRIRSTVRIEGLQEVRQLEQKLLDDPRCMERFLLAVTVNVTTMFRDPDFYRAFREHIVPQLRRRTFFRIWHAGCATGEEVYSMAILLSEEGLYHRARLYATDVNEHVIAKAKAGIFAARSTPEYEQNYEAAGGRRTLSHYYTAMYGHVIFRRFLKDNIVFSQHNLVADGAFNSFDVILCRNVLIYFNDTLTRRVHDLLFSSLRLDGYLGLGNKETIDFTPYQRCFEVTDAEARIYRKRDAQPATEGRGR